MFLFPSRSVPENGAPAEPWTVWENPFHQEDEAVDTNGGAGPSGDYLLFKQIAGPVWPRLPWPLDFAQRQMFKSPTEGVAVLQRNEEVLGQNRLWIRGWTAGDDCRTLLLIG